MANESVTFEAVVTYRFKTRNPDPCSYRCYATVSNGLKSDLIPGEQVIISGYADMYVQEKQKLLLTGAFSGMDTYREPMRTFRISRVRPAKDRTSLIAYFSSDRFNGVGRKRAIEIIETLGLDCLDKIRDDPACLDRIPSLSQAMRDEIRGRVCDDDMEVVLMRLCPGVSAKFLAYMAEHHAKDWRAILDKDPYVLLNESDECPAITFALVDGIGKSLGVGRESIHRIKYCVRDVVKALGEKGVSGLTYGGNLFINLSDPNVRNYFVEKTVGLLGIGWDKIQAAVESGDAGVKLLNVYGPRYDGVNYSQLCGCYLSEKLKAEAEAGEILRAAANADSIVAKASSREILGAILDYNRDFCDGAMLTPEQMLAIRTAMTHRVSVLTGGPGSGKTTVIRGVIYAWRKLCVPGIVDDGLHRGSVTLAAPTGMAVKRMNDAVAKVRPELDYTRWAGESEDFDWESHTLAHYVYTLKQHKSDLKTLRAMRASGRNRLVIIDETSMVSMTDFAEFVSLVPDAQFVFVGDADQLPSIAPGEVFKNLCVTGVIPVSRLTVNHRSKGAKAINDNMAIIRNGQSDLVTDPGVFDIDLFDHEDAAMLDAVVSAYMSELKSVGRLQEIAMISPRNSRGTCSVSHLNTVIRDRLNPRSMSAVSAVSNRDDLILRDDGNEIPVLSYSDNIDGKTYRMRVGDRVVITRNNSAAGATDATGKPVDASVVNGDRGFIRKYRVANPGTKRANHSVVIELDDGRFVTMEDANLKHIELAYATTVHKTQGCEYASVIFIAQGGMCFGSDFATRNLIYTAITRAKRHCRVMGLKPTIDYCVEHERPDRNSMLASRIAGMM